MRLAGVGAYAPRFRLPAAVVRDALGSFQAPGVESVAVPDADEDPVTMAWEACTRALDAAEVAGPDLAALYLASTALPTLDESPIPHIATALDAPDSLDARAFTASTAAAGEALATALDAQTGPVLVVATDTPCGDPDAPEGHAAGAGAAAVVLTDDGPGRVDYVGSATRSYPGTRFRPAGADASRGLGITGYDREAYTETLQTALADVDSDAFDAVALTMPDGKVPYRAASACGVDTSAVAAAATVSALGDTGAAGALLGVANAIERGAESVLVAPYGSGSTCHAFGLDTDGVPVESVLDGTHTLDYATAMRLRGTFSSGQPAGGGANVTTPTYQRSLAQRYRLAAGACRACGALAFPPDHACPDCGARDGYDPVTLPREGTIQATTVIGTGGAPPEFVDQQHRGGPYGTAIVSFEADDGSVDVPLQVVLASSDDAPTIGDRVTTVFRVLYDQHGSRRYALKARPVD